MASTSAACTALKWEYGELRLKRRVIAFSSISMRSIARRSQNMLGVCGGMARFKAPFLALVYRLIRFVIKRLSRERSGLSGHREIETARTGSMESSATLAIVAAMMADRIAKTWDLYSGVKKLHVQCSSCFTCDVDASNKTPPNTPTTVSGPFEPTTRPPSLQVPNKEASSLEGAPAPLAPPSTNPS